ncbi:lipoprotein-releasing ABC transporter permease subunit LolE [Thalassotalea ganghwensis]
MASFLSLYLGSRYLKSRHQNGFASFISASSTIGIGLGVLVLIVVLSAMNGFERALAKHLLSVVPHAELISVNKPMDNWHDIAKTLATHPDVLAVAPVIKVQGLLQKKAQLKGVEIRGVDVQGEQQVSQIADYITQGSWQQLNIKNSIILGEGTAKKLGVEVGDSVQVLLPNLNNSNVSANQFSSPVKQKLNVVGLFKFGGSIDDNQAYISLPIARSLLNYEKAQVQGIRLAVSDVFQAPVIARQAARTINHYVYIYDWTYVHGGLFNDIQLVRAVMMIVLILVIAVASFNIVSTLIMVVNEKKGDIAILKTMGAKNSTLLLTFVIQGLVNGIVGSATGAVLGVLIADNLTAIMQFIEQKLGSKLLAGDVYFIDYLPSELQRNDVVVTVVIALALSFFATLYPAWRATKIEPAQVLGQL